MIPYNVLLVDESVPGLDGIKSGWRLVARKASDADILMLTAAGPGTESPGIEQSGGDPGPECRYLAKPVKRADLLGAVMEITGRKTPDHANAMASA